MTYDVIIVGARCAGAALGLVLSRQGTRVLMVDRATFPSDIPHGHFIHRHGPMRLKRWGVLDRLADRTPAIDTMLFDVGDFPLVAGNLVEDGVAWGYGPRRTTFDHLLLDMAVDSGADLLTGTHVQELLFDDDAVVGIRGQSPEGAQVEARAPLTIGADGRRSGLAKAVRAPVYNEMPTILCYYFSYWSGVESHPFELYVRAAERRVLFSFKTEQDQLAIFQGLPLEELDTMRRDLEGAFMSGLDTVPEFAERVRAGRREERFYGATDLPNFYRKPYGPGWALVGDAGLHKDPYLALGMCDALRDVELLAEAIQDGLGGRQPLDAALARYETRRNDASAADYRENIASARFTPLPPHVMALRAAVRNRPDEATHMIKARMGMVDPATFFNPANVQRLLGAV